MPHEIVLAKAEARTLDDVVDIGRVGDGLLLQLRRLENGDALVIAMMDATRDGMPMLGNLGIVDRGRGALIRTAGTRVEITWQARSGRCAAKPGSRCRVCFGTFAAGETAVVCPCEVVFHEDCDQVRLNCPGCGAPREEGVG